MQINVKIQVNLIRIVSLQRRMEKSYEFHHLHNMLNLAALGMFLISVIVCIEQFLFRETNEEGAFPWI